MKLLIAVPTYETIYPDTYKSIWDMDKCDQEVIFEYVRGYDCAMARNKIVDKGQQLGVDVIFMVDNDVTVPKDALRYYLEHPVNVLLGAYAHRGEDNLYHGNTCVCKLLDSSGKPYFNYPLESEYTAEELITLEKYGQHRVMIHGGGSGCAFVRREVYDSMPYPWYKWVLYEDENRGVLGEDLYFCEQCKAKGIEIYTDPRLRCGHMMRHLQEVE